MNRELPTISVITVVRDNADGLRLTCDSLLAQSYRNVQHVIVDGGQDDDTAALLNSYHPVYRTKAIREPDGGIYDAMNKGLRLSDGDLCLFLNGGDTLTSSTVLRTVADSWQRMPEWSWGYGRLKYVDDRRREVRTYLHQPFSRRKVAQGRAFAPHPTTFVSRDLALRLGGFRTRFGFSADQEFATRAAALSEPLVWDDVLADYLISGSHERSSFLDTARRYRDIRLANDLLVLDSNTVDRLFTITQGIGRSGRRRLSPIKHLLSRQAAAR